MRGALMLGSITASGQQDLSRLERTWEESSPRPVEYGALVLAHDALSGGFWCEVRLFGLGFGVGCAFLGWILVRGAPCLGWILVRGMWCADFGADFGARCVVFGLDFGARCAVFGLDFGARCVVRRFWGRFRRTVCLFGVVFGAPFLGSILVRGVWCADFGADFVAQCAFLGSILARCLFGIDFRIDFCAWCADVGVDHSQRATRSIQIGEDLGGSSPRPVEALVVAHDALLGGLWCEVRLFGLGFGVWCAVFGLDFGARCAVFGLCGPPILGPISVDGASFLGSLLVRGAPFLGSILVRVVWCADFRADFGARCAFLGSQDWKGPGRNRARDMSNMGPWSWRMVPSFWCAVRRFWGGFWCAVRCFWAGFWCAVCGAPILGPISVHGASFLGSILVRGSPFLGSILVRGVWCADFGVDFGARWPFWGRFWCVARPVCGAPILGRISLHGAPFWVRFWRVAFLGSIFGSIFVRGALMLGSITASGQQDLSKHEHFAF